MFTGCVSLISILALVVSSSQPLSLNTIAVAIPLVTPPPYPIQLHVSLVQITPDRSRVIYMRSGSPDQLWVTDLNEPLTGRRLLIDTTRDGGIGACVLTPDSQFAVVVAIAYPPSGAQQVTLYRVPLNGGPKVALAPANAFGWHSGSLRVTPDGSRVVLSAEHGGGLRVLSIPTAGGALTPLTDPIPTAGVITDLQVTADSTAVTYRRALTYGGQMELFGVPLGGGPATRLSPTLTTGGNVLFQRLTPDGTRVVFLADATVDGRVDLYSTPVGGGPATLLDTAAANAVFALDRAIQITADSQRVVYSNAEFSQLKSIGLTGGSPATVNPTMPHLYWFEPTTDSQHVLFVTDQTMGGEPQLYSAPMTGGAVTRLNPDLVLGTGKDCCFVLGYTPTAEVVFVSQDNIYAAPVAGGSYRWLAAGSPSTTGKVAADGSFVYYVWTTPLGQDVIKRVPLAGGIPELVSGPLYQSSSYPFELVANATRVVYFGQTENYGMSLLLGFPGSPLSLPVLLRDSTQTP